VCFFSQFQKDFAFEIDSHRTNVWGMKSLKVGADTFRRAVTADNSVCHYYIFLFPSANLFPRFNRYFPTVRSRRMRSDDGAGNAFVTAERILLDVFRFSDDDFHLPAYEYIYTLGKHRSVVAKLVTFRVSRFHILPSSSTRNSFHFFLSSALSVVLWVGKVSVFHYFTWLGTPRNILKYII